ncbi:MAG: hypothetical protein EXQ48_05390 [Acidobacteria bacterium]|nr:hypothetical protein [Acidobacteriota bacterium]
MTSLSDAISLLRGTRDALAAQLDAVDRALAALGEAAVEPAPPPPTPAPDAIQAATAEVLPTRIRSPKTLTDEHKFALKEGKRRALHSKEVAAGRARELLDPAPGPASASASAAAGHEPRLVKRTTRARRDDTQ